MVLHDDRTGRGYPLPHPDNLLHDETSPADGDVMRLRGTITQMDADLTGLESRIGTAEQELMELGAAKAAMDLSNVVDAAFKTKANTAGVRGFEGFADEDEYAGYLLGLM